MRRISKKIKEWHKRKLEKRTRNPKYFEDRLYEFLEFLFIKETIEKLEVKKKLNMTSSELNLIEDFAKKKHYIIVLLDKKINYEISDGGVDYLLKLKKIKEEQKTSFWIKGATITIAIFTFLTFIINFSASVYPIYEDFCPEQINKYPNYTATFKIPFSNIGGNAYFFRLDHKGKDFERLNKKGLFVISAGEKLDAEIKLQIINPEINKTQVHFSGKYQSLFVIPKFVKSETCFYEKDEYGNFDLIEQKFS